MTGTMEVKPQPVSAAELGVRLFKAPPDGFDPHQADDRELLLYGFPARPDAKTHPELAEQWARRVAGRGRRIEPQFVRNVGKVHGPRRRGQGHDNATSTNWSGSVVFNTAGTTIGWVEGEWTVPDPDDPHGGKSSYYSSAWVGIDGDGSPDVLQAGTESSLINGTKSVYAWWEWYPNYEIAISNFPVSPGDTMYCLICANSNNTSATIYLTNDNTDQHTSFNITAPSGTTLHGNCAEWIVETPSVGGSPTTLPDYGTCYFDTAVAGERNGTLLDGFTGTPITLVNSASTPLSVPTLEKAQLVKLTYRDV
jgi:hypothetical protein